MSEILVIVTAADIAHGKRGDCLECPVAIALTRATGTESGVYRRDWELWLDVGGMCIEAPCEVVQFVNNFDDDRHPSPFGFAIPSLDSGKWKEECYGCQEMIDPDFLNDEGMCESCR